MKQKLKKLTAKCLAVLMFVTAIPFHAFAENTPEALPEAEIDISEIPGNAFYFTSQTAELQENEGHSLLLKVARTGAADIAAAVKITMLDFTARYGEDYSVRVVDRKFTEGTVQDPEGRQSVRDYLGDPEAEEYNYSDALIDGSITAGEQLTDTEAEKELGEITEDLLAEKASRSEAVRRQEALTLSGAKELMTGIRDDKEAMTYSSEDGLPGSILFGEGGFSGDVFLSSGKQEISTALASAYVEINFAEGVTERYLEISPIDNRTSEGSRQAEFSLESCDGSLICEAYGSFTLIITDDEEYVPDTVQFSAAHFDPAGGYVTVKLERAGALNEIASVMLDSEEGTAREGVNYSAVHTKVWFVCGQSERTVKIPVATQGLSEDGEFLLKISEAVGCEAGALKETSVTVHLTDESFDAGGDRAVRQDEGEDSLLEAEEQQGRIELAETDEEDSPAEELLGSGAVTEGAKLQEDINLVDNFPTGDSKVSVSSSGVTIEGEREGQDDVRLYNIPLGGLHYDWNGFHISWKKDYKGSLLGMGHNGYVELAAYGETEGQLCYTGQLGEWEEDYMLSVPSVRYFKVKTIHKAEFKYPLVDLYKIIPIKRVFQISLEQAQPVPVIGEDGELVSNDQLRLSSEFEVQQRKINRMHRTILEEAVDGVLTTVAGGKVTVSLEEKGEALTKIKALQIYNPSAKKWETLKTSSGGKGQLSFQFDNAFLTEYNQYVSYVKNKKAGGLKGMLRIRPVVERIPAVIQVKENTNISLSLLGEGNTVKKGTANSGLIEYQYYIGDMIRYKPGKQDNTGWILEGVRKKVSRLSEEKILWVDKETGLAKDLLMDSTVMVSPSLTERNNRLVVLVAKTDMEKFDLTKGIFAGSASNRKKDAGDYWELEIAAEGSRIAGAEFELQAVTKDSGEIPVWHSAGEGKDYSQSLFYYTGAATAKENVLYLSVGTVESSPYVVRGKFLYVNSTEENTGTITAAALPAAGLSVQIDTAHYGLSLKDGSFETMQFSGRRNCLVKLKISTPDGYQFKTVKLNKAKKERKTEQGRTSVINAVNIGNELLEANGGNHPELEMIKAEYKQGQKWSSKKSIPLTAAARQVRFSADVVCPEYFGETPLWVEFVVIDGKTGVEKAVFKAEEKSENTFFCTAALKAGNYSEYSTGDRLYARVVTDRKVINPTDLGEGSTVMDSFAYPLVDTGVKFTLLDEDVTGSTAASRISASIPTEGIYELPVIGELSMVTKIGDFSLEVQENNNGGVRLLFGKNGYTKLFDSTGKPGPESGKLYGTGDFEEGIRELSRSTKELQEGKKTAAQSLGLSSWSFYPTTGIYLEFAKSEDSYQFTGGGGFLGTDSSFRYTHYLLVCGVPVYVGGKASVQLAGEFGLAPKETKTYQIGVEENRPNQSFYDTLLENAEYNYVFRGKASGSGYTSETICGSLGVRGGFRLEMYYVNDSTIKNAYPGRESTGFAIKGNISFRAESMLLSAELPVENWKDWKGYGYFSDPTAGDVLSAAEENGDGNLLYSAAGTELTAKPRQEAEEYFTANDTEELQLLGSGYSQFGEKTIIENSYDQPSQQVLAFEAGGEEKLLMVYLSDDRSRAQNERTALMYTVYDRASGQWSTPKKVDAGSEHADFSPQLTELTGEKEILISWVSRNEELPEKDYSAYLSSAEIYTARFDMEAAPEEAIHDVCCMTDDAYFNTSPKAVYDEKTGDIQLFFLKSAVPSGIRTVQDLLMAVLPQQNKAEMAYLLFSGKEERWLTDQYFGAELADPKDAEILLSVLHGQRFVRSQIGSFTVGEITADINNPVISDYDVITANLFVKTQDQILEEWRNTVPQEEQEKWKDPQTGDDAADAYMLEHKDEINGLFNENCCSRGIYAYTVDADNSLDTDWDREIFLQTYDFEEHTFTEPYRLTENVVAETGLQLVKKNSEAWLFWIEEPEKGTEDGSRKLKYVYLSGLNDTEDALRDQICTAEIDRLEGENAESTFGSYRVFADEHGNLLAAWLETGKEAAEDEEQNYYSNQIFIAGYCPEKESRSGWSDGVLLASADTGTETVSDSLQLVMFKDEELNLFTNRCRLPVESEDGNVESSELVQTIYQLRSSVSAAAVKVVEKPEEAEEPFNLLLTLENNGIKTSRDPSFTAQLILDEEVLDSISGQKVGESIPAGDFVELSIEMCPGRELSNEEIRRLTLDVSVQEEGSWVSEAINLPLYDHTPEYVLEETKLEQMGDVFLLNGLLEAADPVEILPTDRFYVFNSTGEQILEETLEEAGINGENGWFFMELPAEKLNVIDGMVNVALIVARGEEMLAGEWVVGYLEEPVLIKLNGSSSDRLYLRPGQQLQLSGSYEGKEYYQDGKFLYYVEDEDIAYLDEDVLIGESYGTTTLCMIVDPYGGYKEITVNVGYYYPEEDEEDPASGAVTQKSGPSKAQALSGSWKQEADGSWYFEKTNGTRATGWGYTGGGEQKEYFHFNEKGEMDTGWYLDTDGNWYYLHETHDGRFGAMDRGWHRDASDNNWYYLDLTTGRMRTGWLKLGTNWYYLGTGTAEATWVQDRKGRWIYKGGKARPYGAMYADENTPDGYTVGPDGAWKP